MKKLHVVAGIVSNARGEVLIQQRSDGPFAGCWEFPGGKVEPGEGRDTALRRELDEELGVCVADCEPLLRLTHRYPARTVDLDVWRVMSFSGEPRGIEGQPLRWVRPQALDDANLLPADGPVVKALRLPSALVIRSPAEQVADRRLSELALAVTPRRVQLAVCEGDRVYTERLAPEFAHAARRGTGVDSQPGHFTGSAADQIAALTPAADLSCDFVLWRAAPDCDATIADALARINVPVFLGVAAAPDNAAARIERAVALGAQGIALQARCWPGG